MGGGEGLRGLSANEYSCAHGAQINFGDLTPNLIYARETRIENKATFLPQSLRLVAQQLFISAFPLLLFLLSVDGVLLAGRWRLSQQRTFLYII
jgi:hypothetical protein